MSLQVFGLLKILPAIKINLLVFVQFLIVLFLFMFGLDVNWSNQPQEIWFQRMGSIMTIFSVYIEISVSRASQYWEDMTKETREEIINSFQLALSTSGLPSFLTIGGSANESKFVSKILVHVFLIVGTIIWGYGDLIYLFFI